MRSLLVIFSSMRAKASKADFSDMDDIVSLMRFWACARRWRASRRFFLRLASSILSLRSRRLLLSFSVSSLVRLPRDLELLGVGVVLALPHERLLGQVVAPFLDGEHRLVLPVLRLLVLRLELVVQALLVGNGGGNLLLGLHQLVTHVDDDLVQHLLRILGGGDQIIDVGLDE